MKRAATQSLCVGSSPAKRYVNWKEAVENASTVKFTFTVLNNLPIFTEIRITEWHDIERTHFRPRR